MILFAFIRFISSEYVEITTTNQDDYLNGSRNSFVKFYSPSCFHCLEMEKAFTDASAFFDDVAFCGVNCADYTNICEKYNVTGTPTLIMFLENQTRQFPYEGERTADGFTTFIEEITETSSKRPPAPVKKLNPLNYYKFLRKQNCSFVLFHDPPSYLADIVKSLARAFEPEENISFGIVDCIKYHNLCERNSNSDLVLFKNNIEMIYHDARKEEPLLHFINHECGTSRGLDGLLSDDAGIIDEAYKIAAVFNDSKNKEELVAQMEKIPGAEFYVTVMKKIMKDGFEKLQKDVERMDEIMTGRKASMKILDNMKIRYNIISLFLPFQYPFPPEL
ncbi:Thioredoxin family protein [Tritrichomonas foetus]|uniref:protein disulfide-isomerase n=1 Tax=Tritrichomonas foetus TaxID=1144522 RepID=A0A1J4KBH5_9EUKA|nr:Thioredoxin family protein [Tritrichomonas foetus]|eukprot:OHT08322.1 Thioredoxin family protein [Tritrichomonas foetus]